MKKLIFLLCFISFNVFALGVFTTVQNGVSLYSDYFPNTAAKFKGTVIFFNGSGTGSEEWGMNTNFLNCAKKQNSLFFYDRSGLGGSPPNLNQSPKNSNTGKMINDQLMLLLEKRHIPAPYILVAHSYGAMYAGYFALKNPKLVKAILLIDPVPSDYESSNDIITWYKKGVLDAQEHSASYMYDHYDGSHLDVVYQLIGFSESKAQIKKLGEINNDIPVVIMSTTDMEYKEKPIKSDWYTTQKQWLNKNPDSKIFQVKSGHFIQIERPYLVCEQIKKLSDEVVKKK